MTKRNITLEDLENSTVKKNNDGLNEYQDNQNTFLQAITNVPSSAKKFAKDVITPFLSPI
jgi:hypothetical protein